MNESTKYVQNCIVNAMNIDDGPGTPTLMDYVLNQRLTGPINAGSDFGISDPSELASKLFNVDWEEVKDDPNVEAPKRLFRAEIPGNMGVCDIDKVPNDTIFYAIDPKNTGKVMIGAANIPKTEVEYTHLIVSPGEKDVVITVFPGDTTPDKSVAARDFPHGTPLTKEQVKELGFDKVKFISNEMEKEFFKDWAKPIIEEYCNKKLNNQENGFLARISETKLDPLGIYTMHNLIEKYSELSNEGLVADKSDIENHFGNLAN